MASFAASFCKDQLHSPKMSRWLKCTSVYIVGIPPTLKVFSITCDHDLFRTFVWRQSHVPKSTIMECVGTHSFALGPNGC